jgi:lambda family phage portal protein
LTKVIDKKLDTKASFKTLDNKIERLQKIRKIASLENQVNRTYTGYNGADGRQNWTRNFNPAFGNPDELSLYDRPSLVARSQDQYRNNPIYKGIIDTTDINSIGIGLRLQSTINRKVLGISDEVADEIEEDIETRFDNYASSVECDSFRRQNLYQMQELGFKSFCIDGDHFALPVRFKRTGSVSALKIMLLSSNRCQNPWVANTDNMRDGIEFTPRGEPKNYWFTKREGFYTGDTDFVKIPAFGKRTGRKNVLHIYKPDMIGQSRGIPLAAVILENLKQSDRYTKAELANAAVQALFTGFITSNRDDAMDDGLENTDKDPLNRRIQDMILDSGVMYQLEEGEKVDFANPTRPQSGFVTFIEMQLKIICVGVNLPYEFLMKIFSSSFNASKAARIEAWRYFLNMRDFYSTLFLEPIYKEWLTEEVATGRINLQGFFDSHEIQNAYLSHEWLGSTQGMIDPVKETNAALLAIGGGLSSPQKESRKVGTNFEKNVEQIRRANKKSEGLSLAPFSLPAAQEEPSQEETIEETDNEKKDEQKSST